jgi:hypothetical protein
MEIPLRIIDNRTKPNFQKPLFGLFCQVISTRPLLLRSRSALGRRGGGAPRLRPRNRVASRPPLCNVLIEINNQADVADLGLVRLQYHHDVLRPARVHELVRRVQDRSQHGVANPIGRLLVGTSFCGLPPESTITVSDFILLHGNNLNGPDEVRRLVDLCRMSRAYTDKPVVFNEDDHTDFGASDNHLTAAISRYGSWGFFDYRRKGEDFGEGYRGMPTSWSVNTARKRAFFESIRQNTGS